jgi:glycerol-3-phosphate dehydrogenase
MKLRAANLAKFDGGHFDVFIVGGGINGAVSAAALSGRGASVALVDRGDFAHFTSQESSNLVWGGFKYLEHYELSLVRKLCTSRNRLIKAYPTAIVEIGFLAALDKSAPFPPWLAGLGAFGYWGIGNFSTSRPRFLTKRGIEKREPVINSASLMGGIEYHDAYLPDNDARFVFSFIRSAIDAGATIANYVEMKKAERLNGRWRITCTDTESGETFQCTARYIINAAGPFADGINESLKNPTEHRIVFSKGIHLVVPKLTNNQRVLAFFDDSQRLFYVIPMGQRSVLGTTDTRLESPRSEVTEQDRDFLLRHINERLQLQHPLTTEDIISERCGVRPLVVPLNSGDTSTVDWTSLSRKHAVEVNDHEGVVSIFGGKLTDCLNVGEEVAAALEAIGLKLDRDDGKWFGEPPAQTRRAFFRQARLMGLDSRREGQGVEPISEKLWRRHGQRAFALLEEIALDSSMAETVLGTPDYIRVELHVAAKAEMITKVEDFLRRRTMISLVIPETQILDSEGLFEVAKVLFGDEAERKLIEYRSTALFAAL